MFKLSHETVHYFTRCVNNATLLRLNKRKGLVSILFMDLKVLLRGCHRDVVSQLPFVRLSTKQLCSNINTGNRGDSQSLLGFVTPVAEFTRSPRGYLYQCLPTPPRIRVTYSLHPRVYNQPRVASPTATSFFPTDSKEHPETSVLFPC